MNENKEESLCDIDRDEFDLAVVDLSPRQAICLAQAILGVARMRQCD